MTDYRQSYVSRAGGDEGAKADMGGLLREMSGRHERRKTERS